MIPSKTSDLVAGRVEAIDDLGAVTRNLDGLVLAAGFEDRAFRIVSAGEFAPHAQCVLIRFMNDVPGNDVTFARFEQACRERFAADRLHIVDLHHREPAALEARLGETLARLPRECRLFGIDVSGKPAYSTCMALKALRRHRATERQVLLYTSADQYQPSFAEYQKIAPGTDEIELLPRFMALEMSENLALDSFVGYRSQNARSCLVLLAGYEAHRSTSVVEAVNPALLLLIYGRPAGVGMEWCLDLSRKLHRKFERSRCSAVEEVSTLQLQETLGTLERYCEYLIDDYDLVIAPVGSKMQTVAAYLFWQRYPETRLTFPLHIGYDPELGSGLIVWASRRA